MYKINLTLPKRFNNYINDLKKESNNIEMEITLSDPLPPQTGGFGWQGIIIFIAIGIATGFLNEIGKDLYNKLKTTLINLKNKLNKQDCELFTINIKLDSGGMLFFNLTSLDSSNFNTAIKNIIPIIKDQNIVNTKKYLFFEYNKQKNKWEYHEMLI